MSFSNNFWGPDDAGVGPVLQRMHEAKQTCEEIHAFFRERIAIEEEYARRMSALGKRALGSSELGSLKQALEAVRATTEAVAQAHNESTAQMKKELNEFDTFAASIRQKRKAIEGNVEKLHKLKSQQQLTAEKARAAFEMDCHKLNGYSAQQNMLMGRELDRNNMKLEKTHMALDMSKRDYQTALRLLQDTTAKWTNEWKSSCDGFQDLEEERISFLKSHLWSYTNIVSSVCVKDDDGCEKVRVALEKCDVDADIASFIRKSGTGNNIADPPKFVDYMSGASAPTNQSYHTASFTRGAGGGAAMADGAPTDSLAHDQYPQAATDLDRNNPYGRSPSNMSRRSSVFGGSPQNSQTNLSMPSSTSPVSRSIERTQSSSPLNKSNSPSSFRDRHHSLFGETPHPVMSADSPSPSSSPRNRSESQGAIEPAEKQRTWSSPFRRRSKRWQSTSSITTGATATATTAAGTHNPISTSYNTSPSAPTLSGSGSSGHSAGFGSSGNSHSSKGSGGSPGVSQSSHSRSHSVLSMGENLFDLGVTSTDTSRSVSPVKKTLPKDDPILAALQRLKVASSDKLNSQPHPASSAERLAPPNAAFTAEEMNAAKKHYANQTSEMYGQNHNGDFMQEQQPPQQQRARRGSSVDIRQMGDGRTGSMESVRQLQRPRSQYYGRSSDNLDDDYQQMQQYQQQQAQHQQYHQQRQQQSSQQSNYHDHRRSKSASPTKQDHYMSFSNYPPMQHQQQQRAGGRSPSPGPQMMGHHRSSSQLSQYSTQQQQYQRRSPSPQPMASDMMYGGGRRSTSPNPYANPLAASPTPSSTSASSQQSPVRRPKYPTVSRDGRPVLRHSRAAYDYRAAIPEEVSFRKGDVMAVLRMQDDGWWEVEVLSSGRFGLAPSNFLVTV